ncbi:MAG: DUF2063 domain-containing protein [Bacteroidia bacterium]|nr:MAG: DUF2063 domain-containing protein [Bacteroidia bacterium]
MLSTSYQRQQSILAEYTRSGNDELIKKLHGVKEKGIRYYRELIFNIAYDTITNAYPILTDFLGEEQMKLLINNFYTHHKCQTFQVWRMPEEFKEYVIQNELSLIEKHPLIPDLLHFEWIEIEMFMMPDEEFPPHHKEGNILKDKLVLNPEIKILALQFPVHLLHPSKISEKEKGQYFVLVHRHPESKEVVFTNANALSVKIILQLNEEPLSIPEIEQKVLQQSNLKFKEQIKQFIRESMNSQIIIGFQ